MSFLQGCVRPGSFDVHLGWMLQSILRCPHAWDLADEYTAGTTTTVCSNRAFRPAAVQYFHSSGLHTLCCSTRPVDCQDVVFVVIAFVGAHNVTSTCSCSYHHRSSLPTSTLMTAVRSGTKLSSLPPWSLTGIRRRRPVLYQYQYPPCQTVSESWKSPNNRPSESICMERHEKSAFSP